MSIYAIADLHLSFGENKPMDVFGVNWQNHTDKIKQNWNSKVSEEDLVLLPGDFSWAMYLEDTKKDFDYLSSLPGKKIMLKGNHDYWWSTLAKMNKYLSDNDFNNIEFLQNNSFLYEDVIIAGTRGWGEDESSDDRKIIARELLRLEMSLKDGISKFGDSKEMIVCMHYPPFIDEKFISLMKRYNVKKCVYGHLHGEARKNAKEGMSDGIEYKLVSSDCMGFDLEKII